MKIIKYKRIVERSIKIYGPHDRGLLYENCRLALFVLFLSGGMYFTGTYGFDTDLDDVATLLFTIMCILMPVPFICTTIWEWRKGKNKDTLEYLKEHPEKYIITEDPSEP